MQKLSQKSIKSFGDATFKKPILVRIMVNNYPEPTFSPSFHRAMKMIYFCVRHRKLFSFTVI